MGCVYFFSEPHLSATFFSFFSYSSWAIHSNITIASACACLSSGHEIGTTAGLSEGVISAKENGGNWLRRLSEDPPDTLPPPLPLCYELLNSRWGRLFHFLKIHLCHCALDLLRLRCVAATAQRLRSSLGIWGSRRLTNDFSGFASWQRWQPVNRENAISCVINY